MTKFYYRMVAWDQESILSQLRNLDVKSDYQDCGNERYIYRIAEEELSKLPFDTEFNEHYIPVSANWGFGLWDSYPAPYKSEENRPWIPVIAESVDVLEST